MALPAYFSAIGSRQGQPGVAMHAHKAGAKITGNLIAQNYIARNGADVADNATPGPTGINIDAGASGEPLTGNTVTGNIIEHEAVDVAGGAKAHYDGIVAFSQTDFTEALKKITVPVLVMHGDDDQIVPYANAGPLSAKLVKNGAL